MKSLKLLKKKYARQASIRKLYATGNYSIREVAKLKKCSKRYVLEAVHAEGVDRTS